MKSSRNPHSRNNSLGFKLISNYEDVNKSLESARSSNSNKLN